MNRGRRTVTAAAAAGAVMFGGLAVVPRLDAAGPANDAYVQQQTAGPLDAKPTLATERLLVIAHNAGDATSTIESAVRNHARIVEIDTSLVGQQLRARHDPTPRSIRDIPTRSETVGQAWNLASTPGILLDLKTSGRTTTQLVAALIATHPTTHVLISTSNQPTLAQIAASNPKTLRLLSVGTLAQLAAVIHRANLTSSFQGLSIANTLLTAPTVRQLHHDHLWIQAWTVDSMLRANQLSSWGVNGITTNSLTMLAALSHSTI